MRDNLAAIELALSKTFASPEKDLRRRVEL